MASDLAGIPVIVTYRVKAGREGAFADVLGRHTRALTRRGLLAPGTAVMHLKPVNQASTFMEIFVWRDQAAIDAAHADPEVGPVWKAMEEMTEENGVTPVHYEAL